MTTIAKANADNIQKSEETFRSYVGAALETMARIKAAVALIAGPEAHSSARIIQRDTALLGELQSGLADMAAGKTVAEEKVSKVLEMNRSRNKKPVHAGVVAGL